MVPVAAEPRVEAAVPFAVSSVPAGFPSPAEDYVDRPLDFNELLITHPAATFAVRVAGDSMVGAGIFAGDIAVVNRALTAVEGSVVLAVLDGAFTLKRYRKRNSEVWLEAANTEYPDIPLSADRDFQIWGVVRHSIRML
jgi:DNA polymerase V